jgi:hypothetical protein
MEQKQKLVRSNNTTKGSVLLLSIIILFVVLSMVLSLTYVTVMEQKMSQKTKSSVGSFYSAESGVEWVLNKMANTTESTITSTFGSGRINTDGSVKCPDAFTDTCKVFLLDQDGKVITDSSKLIADVKAVRSVGTQGGETQRAIEAAVASGGGGCYVDYSLGAGLAVGTSCGAVGGFTVKKSAGSWGVCAYAGAIRYDMGSFRPPGGNCPSGWSRSGLDSGEAYVCCM